MLFLVLASFFIVFQIYVLLFIILVFCFVGVVFWWGVVFKRVEGQILPHETSQGCEFS